MGYCLPLGEQTEREPAGAIATGKRAVTAQLPRTGSELVLHSRFNEADLMVDEPPTVSLDVGESSGDEEQATRRVSLLTLKIAKALEPLEATLRALTCYERQWWPQVRVLSEPHCRGA